MYAIILLVLIILFIFFLTKKRSEKFYEVENVYPRLAEISTDREKIVKEVERIDQWTNWPEKNLWDPGRSGATWTIFPLRAFGKVVVENCAQVPTIAKFVEEMDREYGVKIAILSKLGPGMKLVPHQGWGRHCNYVLRCHYGISVPPGCNIQVADEVTDKCNHTNKLRCCYDGYDYAMRHHANDKWIVFDDSKLHMAENLTNSDRIVLILDIKRPDNIPVGTSNVEDTKELENIVASFSQ